MKKSLFLTFLVLCAGTVLAQDKGLQLGEEEYFSGSGTYSITARYEADAVLISIPSSIVVDRFVIYRSTSASAAFRKVGQTRDFSYRDDKIDRNTTYFYVAVGLRKEKQDWVKVQSGIASATVPAAEKPAPDTQTTTTKDQTQTTTTTTTTPDTKTTPVNTTGTTTTPDTKTTPVNPTDTAATPDNKTAPANTTGTATETKTTETKTTPVNTTGTAATPDTKTTGTTVQPPPVQTEPVVTDALVTINSTPAGAQVSINDKPSGLTPFQARLKFGSYRVKIEKTGFKTWLSADLGVTFGGRNTTDVTLERIRAALNVTTAPAGAQVKVNGQPRGIAPLVIQDLEYGDHRVSAEMKGYLTAEQQIRVENETPLALNLVLQNESGGVRVLSTPTGASVFIDNIRRGVTPLTVEGIPTGIHSLLLTKDGYSRMIADITVEAGPVRELAFSLQQQNAYLSLTSVPDSAECLVDGALAGRTPLSMLAISVGAHNLLVRKEGFQDYSEVFTAAVDQLVKREITLSPRPATLIVNSVPDRVRISINDRDYGYTPFLSAAVSAGNYVIVLQKEGYHSLTNRLTLTADMKRELALQLRPLPAPVQQNVQQTVQPAVVENGSLSVLTVPSDAEVSLNNVVMGRTPFITSVAPGTYMVTVKKQGFRQETVSAAVESGKARNLQMNLTRVMARLYVKSIPEQAQVLIDSIPVGLTPLSTEIASGDHVIKVGKAGMKSVSETLSVSATNREIDRAYTLQPEVFKFAFTSTPPGAEVYVDGKMLGLTPFEIPHSGTGTYVVIFHKAGYKDWKYNLVISQGQPQSLNAVLEAPQGALLLKSEPQGELYIDGSYSGRTGSVVQLAAGIHKIIVKSYGYYDYETQVKIVEGKTTEMSAKMTEKPKGALNVSSTPAGASIMVDGIYRGQTPMKIEKLPEGFVNVRLKLKGYKTWNTVATITPGQTMDVNAMLQKGGDCCLCNGIFAQPWVWYVSGALSLVISGSAYAASTKPAYSDSRRESYRNTAYVFGGAGVACFGIGFVFHLTGDK
jgi:CRISPR/Cas system-associated exonuclease Cas4 (RecB family)